MAEQATKPVTVDLIEEYLDKFGWKAHEDVPEPDEKEGVVMTGWRGLGDEGHPLVIDPIVEKGALLFKAIRVAQAPPDDTAADRLNGLLLAMSALNFKYILGGWAYDPRDGEVAFKVGMPVDSDDLDYKDFEHCLNVVVMAVEADGPSLKAVLDGSKTAQEILESEKMQGT